MTARQSRSFDPAPNRPSEAACQSTIVDAATRLGYLVHAERPARQGDRWLTAVQGHKGWPDLVIVGHGRLLVVELKRRPNRVEPDQQKWLDALTTWPLDVRVVWVPEGMDLFISELQQWANR